MKASQIAIFLLLFMHLTVAVHGRSDETVLGTLGQSILLPCYVSFNATPSFTRWMKNGQLIISRNHTSTPKATTSTPKGHLTILDTGSLNINRLSLSDEAIYACDVLPQDNNTQTGVSLKTVSGPDNETSDIQPSTTLPNGTLVVHKGSAVSFNCSSSSYPSQTLLWGFQGVASSNDSLAMGGGAWLDYRIKDIQPSSQGEYSCRAQNTLSKKNSSWSQQLLVYYAPERHPECSWKVGEDPSHVQFLCTWLGGYPTPTLLWGEDHEGPRHQAGGHLFTSEVADSLTVMQNRSMLYDGLKLKCEGTHPVISPKEERFCGFTLKSPYPEGQPLVSALEGTNVTLTCTESSSIPPANTAWKRTAQQEDIIPSSKYILSDQGPTFTLTIVKVSKDDEGLYFCRSENPLMVRELEVSLTVKTSSAYTGAIIGTFLAILIVGSGFIIAKMVYSSRDRICLGNGFGRMEEESGDVFSLVESDEEEVFHEPVPRLPPLTNGHNTTLVQIHRIPSSDHEEPDIADVQQGNAVTEEPVELVTF